MIGLPVDGFQRRAGVEDAAASRAKHVPGHLERTDAGGVQKCRDGFLLIETMRIGKGERIDAVEVAVRAAHDQIFDALDRLRVGRLSQGCKKHVHFAHSTSLCVPRRKTPVRRNYNTQTSG